jgi:hypothetical protein
MILTALEPSGPLHFNDLGRLCDLDPTLGRRVDGSDTTIGVRSGVLPEPHRGREDRGRLLPERRAAGGAGWPLVRQGCRSAGLGGRAGGDEEGVPGGLQHDRPQDGGAAAGPGTRSYARFADILQRKLAAEPHATHERYLQLEREASQETRRSPVYTDITIAHNKSVSVLHASFREQARRARLAGDTKREELWRAREERVQQILQETNHAALEWVQEHAGFTRTGYHGRKDDAGPVGARQPGGHELAAGNQP